MKADANQIPVKNGQTKRSNQRTADNAGPLWRRIRDMQARLLSIEGAVSTIRRDVNRIDRKNYREDEKNRPSFDFKGNGENDQYPVGLFGGT